SITSNDLICAAVLSGNRNFEARIHPNIRANFLASPPLVVAFAIAGTVLKDLTTEPLGEGTNGPVYLRDIWPSSHEIAAVMSYAKDPATFRRLYGDLPNANPMWKQIAGSSGDVYNWPKSTYIAKPPFFDGFSMKPKPPVRIKNLMLPPNPDGSRVEGGVTFFHPGGERMSIYDAAMKYQTQGIPTVVFGGEEYGTGSSRDWAAKGTQLLGVKAVVAKSFER